MLVFCDGMPRSASTWSFNVVMQLLRRAYVGEQVHGGYGENVAEFLAAAPPTMSHVVLKCHTLDHVGRALAQTKAAKAVYTWRSVSDALASFMTMFGYDFDHALSMMHQSLELYQFHLQNGNSVTVGYREITEQPLDAIERISKYLGLQLDVQIIADIGDEMSLEQMAKKVKAVEAKDESSLIKLPNTIYDPETLLNQHHILDGRSGFWSEKLTIEQLQQVEELVQKYPQLVE
jgi:hypothetical protein